MVLKASQSQSSSSGLCSTLQLSRGTASLLHPVTKQRGRLYSGYYMMFYKEMSNPLAKPKKAACLITPSWRWVQQNCTENVPVWNTEPSPYAVGAAHFLMHVPHDLDSICPINRWEMEARRYITGLKSKESAASNLSLSVASSSWPCSVLRFQKNERQHVLVPEVRRLMQIPSYCSSCSLQFGNTRAQRQKQQKVQYAREKYECKSNIPSHGESGCSTSPMSRQGKLAQCQGERKVLCSSSSGFHFISATRTPSDRNPEAHNYVRVISTFLWMQRRADSR